VPDDFRWDGAAVLVTGAGGFLGRAVCRLLLARGARVHGLTRASPTPAGVVSHEADLSAPGMPEALVSSLLPSAVLHLASPVNLSRDPAGFPEMQRQVLGATDALARACLAAGARLLYVGTCEEYGDGPAPFSEDQAPRPVSPYSAAKAAASAWVHCMARTGGLQAVVARPFLTYGPEQRGGRLIPAAIDAALAGRAFPMTDGAQTREVNYVDDVARGLVAAAGAGRALGEVINIGGGEEIAVRALAERIFDRCGAPRALVKAGALPRRGGEVPRFVGDHRKARRLLGHAPQIGLDEGLDLTIAARRSR
jgi:UDP-glucose 4-epimerase